ncbi:MAG: hypothetical protein ACLQLC_03995 [Candidatus Sulfotelmatobacter sp.]
MKTTQAWAWLTAGVLALGLNGMYQDGGAAWAHRTVARAVGRIEARVQPVIALGVGHADWLVAKTESVAMQVGVVQDEPASFRVGAAMVRVQSKLVRTQMRFANLEQMSARREAALARVEASRARVEAQMERLRFTPAAFVMEDVSGIACSRAHPHSVR